MAISDQDIQRFRHILMYDDETVMDAVVAYRDADRAAEWWTLVVDLGGRYASASFADVSAQVRDGKKEFLGSPLGKLVGTLLMQVDAVVEQSAGDLAAAQEKAAATPSKTAVVVERGEFKGVVTAPATRAGAGLFGSELVKLAGQYADLPTTGLVSRRRQEAIAKRKKSG